MAVTYAHGCSGTNWRTARGFDANAAAQQAARPSPWPDYSAYQNAAAAKPKKPVVRVRAGSAPSPTAPRHSVISNRGMGGACARTVGRHKDPA